MLCLHLLLVFDKVLLRQGPQKLNVKILSGGSAQCDYSGGQGSPGQAIGGRCPLWRRILVGKCPKSMVREKSHRKNNFLLKRSQIAYYTF